MSNSIPETCVDKQQQSAVTLGGIGSSGNSFGQFPEQHASLTTMAWQGSVAKAFLMSRGRTTPSLVANTLSPSFVQLPWQAMNTMTRSFFLAFRHIQSIPSSNSLRVALGPVSTRECISR